MNQSFPIDYKEDYDGRFMPMNPEREKEAIESFRRNKEKFKVKTKEKQKIVFKNKRYNFSIKTIQLLLWHNFTTVDIARAYDCSEYAIRRRIKKHNLDVFYRRDSKR